MLGLRQHADQCGTQRIYRCFVDPGVLQELVDRRKQGGTRPGQRAGGLGADRIGQRIKRRIAQVVHGQPVSTKHFAGGGAKTLQQGSRPVHGLQANESEFIHQRFQVVYDFGESRLQLEIVFQYHDGSIVRDRPFPQGKVARIAADLPRRRIVATRIELKEPVIDPPEPVGMAGAAFHRVKEFKRYAAFRHLFGRFGAPDPGRA